MLLLALSMIVPAIAGLLGFFHEPPLKIDQSGNFAIVNVETLGEYPTTIGRVRITDDASGRVVLEDAAKRELLDKAGAQIYNFRLAVGENSTNVVEPESGTYEVIEPCGRNSFILQQGVKYRLRIWGDSWTYRETSFRF
jgi:hypothetical protein